MGKKNRIPPGNRRGGQVPRKGPQIITPGQDQGGMSPEAILAQMAAKYEDQGYVEATIVNALSMHLGRVYGFSSANLNDIVSQFVGRIVEQSKARLEEIQNETPTEGGEGDAEA